MLAPSGWLNDQRKIGLGLAAFGFLFTMLGIMMFFDRGLLAMGNLLFLAGMTLTIGVQATVQFFTRRRNRQGSAFYLGGACLVIIGWTMTGMLVEAYGFWLLFCEFIPTVLTYARRVPFVGRALEVPWLRTLYNKASAMGGLPKTMDDARSR
ncbi:MAG: Got1/Sft2-like family-domain-containing protein [Monoraphidium minutum]|nr:MAG: Got1/Sft2-like family-domain-containing protein [Monoraphidium minutum]